MVKKILVAAICALLVTCPMAAAKEICTLVVTADQSAPLYESGDCDRRVTPASTFKIALALMGYDMGILHDTHAPRFEFRNGYADWGGYNWRQPTGPQRWMKYSVVWYSRLITPQIGMARLTGYATAFGYGNADFSGDFAQSNGLERAWMSSSLKISPREQAEFLLRMVNYQLPVLPQAVDSTRAIIEHVDTPYGLRVWGKSGTAYPRGDTGSFDYANGWGWYVGWAAYAGRTVFFAHVLQDTARQETSPGQRARAAMLDQLDRIALTLEQP